MGRKFTKNPARPVTFSINDDALHLLHEKMEAGGYKSRSNWLRSVLKSGRTIDEMSTAQILGYLLGSREEIFEHISRPLLVKMIQELSEVIE